MKNELCNLKVLINGRHAFFVNQVLLCLYSAKLGKMINQENKKKQKIKRRIPEIKIMDFPGGPDGFEMITRFCYNNGKFAITPSNVCILHCSAVLLEMTDEISAFNLLTQTESFLNGVCYWRWDDILKSLISCEPILHITDSSGISKKLVSWLVSMISRHPGLPNSPFSYSYSSTPDSIKNLFNKEWWFDDLTVLSPNIIARIMKAFALHSEDSRNIIPTIFLLHYLKKSVSVQKGVHKSEFSNLANTAVYGVVSAGQGTFTCRGLFWVLRIVSNFGLSKECRHNLELLIGLSMDQATLDDLLVSGNGYGVVYDVNLVLRLVGVFVQNVAADEKMKKVGRLVDKYLGEISPDHSLRVSKFLAVAESFPDSTRDCSDGVYQALEIYLESHPNLSAEDRKKLCRCINYGKLTLEACKDLARNPRIPPQSAMQAMVSHKSKICKSTKNAMPKQAVVEACTSTTSPDILVEAYTSTSSSDMSDDRRELKFSLQKMQSRVIELEKVCSEMKYQMSKMVKGKALISKTTVQRRGMPKLC